MMQQPEVLLADEPIASLDPLNAKVVMDSLQDINLREGITVITNLHTLDTARAYCHRIVGMAAGKVVFDGPPEELTERPCAGLWRRRQGGEISEAITSTSHHQQNSPHPPAARAAGLAGRTRIGAMCETVFGKSARIAGPRQRRLSKFERTRRDTGNQQERQPMFRKMLFGAAFIARLRGKCCPRRRYQGVPRRHPWRRERGRPAEQLPVPRRPLKTEFLRKSVAVPRRRL